MQFLNLQPIQSVRFETKSTHKAEAFVFSVPALKNLVDLAEASSSAKISNKIDLQRQNLTFVQRNDVGGNQWTVSYKRDGQGTGRLSLEVTRPEVHLDFEGGHTPSVFGSELYWMSTNGYQPCKDNEDKLITLQPGDTRTWEIGSVPEMFQCIPKGDLFVKVVIVYYYYCHLKRPSPMGVPRTSEIETKTQLSVDFEELLSDGDSAFSDFHIEHEGKYFHLHKAILAARCPAVKKMFKENVADSEVAERLTSGNTARILDILVHYLYKGELLEITKKDGVETLEQLLVTADKWEIPSLKLLVNEKAVMTFVNLENAEYLLELCVTHNLRTAEHCVTRFISKNIRKILAAKKTF